MFRRGSRLRRRLSISFSSSVGLSNMMLDNGDGVVETGMKVWLWKVHGGKEGNLLGESDLGRR